MHLVIHRKKHVPSSYPWKKPKVLHIYHHIQIHRNPGSWVLEPPSLCHWDQVESFFGSHSMVLRISRLVFGEGMGSSGTFKAFLAFLMNLLATRKPGTWYGSWKVVMQIWWGLKISPYLSQNRSKYEVFFSCFRLSEIRLSLTKKTLHQGCRNNRETHPLEMGWKTNLSAHSRRRCLRRSMNWMLGISTKMWRKIRVWSSVTQQQKIHEHTNFHRENRGWWLEIYHPKGTSTIIFPMTVFTEVTTYQMCILMLFNQQSTLSYQAR